MFGTPETWLYHLSGAHSNLVWTCTAAIHRHSQTSFSDPDEFQGHMHREHPGAFHEDHLPSITKHAMHRHESACLSTFCSTCPICSWSPKSMATAQMPAQKRRRRQSTIHGVSSGWKSRKITLVDGDRHRLDIGSSSSEESLEESIVRWPQTLEDHIAGHLHDFALMALPLESMSDERSSETSSPAGDSKSRSTIKNLLR